VRLPGTTLGCAAAAAVLALVVPGAWRAAASDLLVPHGGAVDPRVLVVAFDGRAPESTFLSSVPHREGTGVTALSGLMAAGGALAGVFVEFDGFALIGGPRDRAAIRNAGAVQDIAIAPLLDVTLADRPDGVPAAVGYRVDELAAEFHGIGVPLVPDGSGVVRTVPEVVSVNGLDPGAVVRPDQRTRPQADLVLGLALRAVARSGPDAVRADGVDLAGTAVPLENGRLRVHWADGLDGRDGPAVLPAGRPLGASGPTYAVVPPSTWAGRIVLVGTTDPTQTRYYDTPLGPMPELFVQANALNTLLTGAYLRVVPAWVAPTVALVLVALVGLLWHRSRRWAALGGTAAAAGWVGSAAWLARTGWVLDPVTPAAAASSLLMAFGATALARQLVERRRLATLFREYVPADVARDLVESGRARIAQAGERLLVTVLFCDLRGFTPIAARLSPADVRALLDRYYETFSRIVLDHGGTVLQYTGDEIFAVFGAPLPRTDHADAALACAGRMHDALPECNAALGAEGLPAVCFGIGLHAGVVVAAHVGSSIRRQYSVIGDPVNVGSRLCGQAGAGQTVFSGALHDRLARPPDLPAESGVRLKGVEAPVTLYRVVEQRAPAGSRGHD
jgi:adenylate cyclase